MTDNYDDIIHLSHHVSKRHPQMSLYNRAAQFAPFAALTGYEKAIAETARQTNPMIEMMEDNRLLMDKKLSFLSSHLEKEPIVTITFFQADEQKEGGHYQTINGVIKAIHNHERTIMMINKKRIKIDNIVSIECNLFSSDCFL